MTFKLCLDRIDAFGNAISGGFFFVGVEAAEAQWTEQPTYFSSLSFLMFCRNVSERRPAENRSLCREAINQMKATSHSAALDMWWIVVDELNHRAKRGKAKEITHSLTHSLILRHTMIST